MPILHASYKSIKQTRKRTLQNKDVKSHLHTEIKKFVDLISSNKQDEAKEQLKKVTSLLDKAVAKGVIHKNTSSRKKSRLMKRLASLKK